MSLTAASAQVNFEEAAAVAAEYISTLDNLPHEVKHILREIEEKDKKSQDIQNDLAKENARYIRRSLRAANSAAASLAASPSPSPHPATPAPSLPLPANATAMQEKLRVIAAEKLALAQKLVKLLTRASARLDTDLKKVRVLQGEPEEPVVPVGVSAELVSGAAGGGIGVNTLKALHGAESFGRNGLPLLSGDVLALSPAAQQLQAQQGGPAQKKRRLTTTTTIKLPSPAPASSYFPLTASSSRNRKRVPSEELDAEGEDDDEGELGEGDPEDNEVYCFCQKLSYGEMIACDAVDCRYGWFHLPCVGLNKNQPLPESFYCSDCIARGRGPAARKGRKK